MKTRFGFVSNSSSSSFVIKKQFLSPEQVAEILRPATKSEDMWDGWAEWVLRETDTLITGYTYMDNFDYNDRFKAMGIEQHVDWEN